MLMKQSLLFICTVLLLNYMNNQCQAVQCYSCSDCNSPSKGNWTVMETVQSGDQCIKATILTKEGSNGQTFVYRGASSRCQPSSTKLSTVLCCRSDLCNV